MEQEGYLALYDAVDGFNPECGYKFLTYAGKWINQRMQHHVQNNALVKIPANEWQKLREYKKVVNAFLLHLGRKPSQREIAHNLGIPVKQVADIEKTAYFEQIGSLDSYLTEDEEGGTIGDMVPGDEDIESDVLEDMKREQLGTLLWPLVDALPGNQGQVLRQRFQENRTLKDTGKNIGVTIEQVRQIEAKAMRGLRCSRNAKLLKTFLDDERVYSIGLSGTGLESFNRTWTSSTERAAIYMLDK